ncbi:uncharacterized protein LOC144097888 [Amblyomma americanum]
MACEACRAQHAQPAGEDNRGGKLKVEIFQAFTHPIAIMDIDNDSILGCLSARRAALDPKTKTATYVWSLAGSDGKTRSHVPFYHMPGDTPDASLYTVGSKDGPVEVGYFRYTDYKNCAILELPHFGDQCTLWVSEEARDSVPDKCLEQYADICGEGVPIFDKKTCRDADK